MKYAVLILLFSTCSVFAEEKKEIKASFQSVYRAYKSDPGPTIKKYRDKVVTWSANATSIDKDGIAGRYRISLGNRVGRVIFKKGEIPEELFKLLWANRRIQKSKVPIKFKAVWKSNRSETFYFYDIKDITWTVPKKKKK